MPIQQQITVTTGIETGLIAIDEHCSLSCLIDNVTATGLTLTVLDGAEIPAAFMLTIGSAIRVCRVVRRGSEAIEARFADRAASASSVRAAQPGLRRPLSEAAAL